ncbi:unnamed protein product [Rotaria socialis]
MMHGRQATLPFDQQKEIISLTQDPEHGEKIRIYLEKLVNEARNNIIKNQQQYKTRYDLNRQNLSLKLNDLVLIKTRNIRNKFDIRYEGNPFQHINLQSLFKGRHNEHCVTHPEMEKRDKNTGPVSSNMVDMSGDDSDDDMDDGKLNDYVQYKCDHITHYDYNATWSLQDAIATTFNKFLDKSQTINLWQCGIDLELDTWKNKLFSRPQYNKHIEQQQRIKMKQYAIDDCIAVAELFLYMCPATTNHHQLHDVSQHASTKTITLTTTTTTTKTTRRTILDLCDDLSDISEDELIQILKPKFDKKKEENVHQPHDPPVELIITTTENEINELIPTQQPPPNTSTTLTLTRNERQRRKNRKLKWKQKHRPDFQRKIKRPIYHRYDYRKIRSQLADDDIHTSHQITINKEKGEVLIGFKSKEEEEKARNKIKINNFSRTQYIERWGSIYTSNIFNAFSLSSPSLLNRFRSLSTCHFPQSRRNSHLCSNLRSHHVRYSSPTTITLFRTKSILPSIVEEESTIDDRSPSPTTSTSQLSCTIVDARRSTANSCNVEELAAYLDNFLYLPKSLSGAAELMYT